MDAHILPRCDERAAGRPGARRRAAPAGRPPLTALRPPRAAPDEPCEERKDCHSCLTNPECGWCAATAACEKGTAKRSLQSACPPARWMHRHGNRDLQCEKANALFLGDAAAEEEEAEG